MNPTEWKQMGGEVCEDPSKCATTEWSLTHKVGQARANEVFKQHWQTWYAAISADSCQSYNAEFGFRFTQEHVDRIKALNLDHVKIPLGFVGTA